MSKNARSSHRGRQNARRNKIRKMYKRKEEMKWQEGHQESEVEHQEQGQ